MSGLECLGRTNAFSPLAFSSLSPGSQVNDPRQPELYLLKQRKWFLVVHRFGFWLLMYICLATVCVFPKRIYLAYIHIIAT